MSAEKELIELKLKLTDAETVLVTLRATVDKQREEILQLRKKLKEPVVLTSRDGSNGEPGKEMSAGEAICKLKEHGVWT